MIQRPLSSIQLGDKVLVTSIERHSGGSATNAGAALATLGLDVKILTKLGDDHDADFIVKELNAYRLKNICLHRSKKKKTDSAVIISSAKEKDRVIYVYKGASQDLSMNDVKKSQLRRAKWIYLGTLMGKSFRTGKMIAKYVRRQGIPLLFNPSLYLARRGKNVLRPILRAATILVLNKEEAQALLETSSRTITALLEPLQQLGPETVVITNGKKTMYARKNDEMYSLTPPPVTIVHTAGAGDAFTAGFLAGIIKGYPVEDAMALGQANASSVIQHIGTKNRLLTEREARSLMKKYRIICRKR
jgi:sugar/nucleoside kinase (ribokinase family)